VHSVHRDCHGTFRTQISAISHERRKISPAQRRISGIYTPLSRQALAINIRTPLFRNVFWLRLSNGATNHCRNDLDVGRNAIIAICILPFYLRFELDTTIEDKSLYELLIFNLDISVLRLGFNYNFPSVLQMNTCRFFDIFSNEMPKHT